VRAVNPATAGTVSRQFRMRGPSSWSGDLQNLRWTTTGHVRTLAPAVSRSPVQRERTPR